MNLIGIDGAKLGYWVLASSGPDGDGVRFDLAKDLTGVFQAAGANTALMRR